MAAVENELDLAAGKKYTQEQLPNNGGSEDSKTSTMNKKTLSKLLRKWREE